MVTFLLILGGLIAFNFILLKVSIQSVDNGSKKTEKEILAEKRVSSTTKKDQKIAEAA